MGALGRWSIQTRASGSHRERPARQRRTQRRLARDGDGRAQLLPRLDAQQLLTKDSLKYKSSPALARSPLLASATVASSPTGAKQRSPYARPSSQLPLRSPMERGTANLGEDLLPRHRGGK